VHKGWFEPGASLIVLLFEAGAVELDRDLRAHTQAGIETRVRMGEAIGRSLR
jgi:phosphatidylserine decarboxylase